MPAVRQDQRTTWAVWPNRILRCSSVLMPGVLRSSAPTALPFTTAGRSPTDFSNPALQVGEVLELLSEVLEDLHPRPACHVGDREGAGKKLAVGQPLVHHAEQAVDLVAVALLAVVELVDRIELRRVD